jgi:hypothetical protein
LMFAFCLSVHCPMTQSDKRCGKKRCVVIMDADVY